MRDDDLYEKFPRLKPVTPGGLLNKSQIRRYTPDLFNDNNDHNPQVAKPCPRCKGKGFYRVYPKKFSNRYDKTCEKCGLMAENRKHQRFMKPSEARKRKSAAARRKMRKLMRLQQQGQLN